MKQNKHNGLDSYIADLDRQAKHANRTTKLKRAGVVLAGAALATAAALSFANAQESVEHPKPAEQKVEMLNAVVSLSKGTKVEVSSTPFSGSLGRQEKPAEIALPEAFIIDHPVLVPGKSNTKILEFKLPASDRDSLPKRLQQPGTMAFVEFGSTAVSHAYVSEVGYGLQDVEQVTLASVPGSGEISVTSTDPTVSLDNLPGISAEPGSSDVARERAKGMGYVIDAMHEG